MEVFLVRHTTPEIEKGICYGQSDLDVTNTFTEEAEKITSELALHTFDAIYSSPLIRCKKLANQFQQPVILDDRLKELNFGDWELKSWNAIPRIESDPWMQDFVNVSTKNGESYVELQQRTIDFYKDIQHQKHQKVLIVTHAGVIRSLWSYWHKTPLVNSFDLKVAYGEILHINTKDL